MKLIPINTKYKYFASEDGRIFNGEKELNGYEHQSYSAGRGYDDKYYLRYTLIMKDGSKKKFYGQRLVAMAYHGLSVSDRRIVRHLSYDTKNNHKDFIMPGTTEENQTIDRIEQGTYMNRGGGGLQL